MTLRRHFLAAAALPVLSAHFTTAAQDLPVEGKHYIKVSPPQPTRDRKKVDVVEFFAYSCSHCYAFEAAVHAWQKKLPADVLFRRVPVAFREGPLVLQQKLYFALEALGLVEQLHGKVFDAIHAQRQRLDTIEEIGSWATRHGADRPRLLETINSFSIAGKARQASQMVDAYGVEGTPSLAVDGRWLTSGSHAGSNPKSLAVADHLITVARKSR
jgi:thiol:disulfide interchange protein DsbA